MNNKIIEFEFLTALPIMNNIPGKLCRAVWYKFNNILEEHGASIFCEEEYDKQVPSIRQVVYTSKLQDGGSIAL